MKDTLESLEGHWNDHMEPPWEHYSYAYKDKGIMEAPGKFHGSNRSVYITL